MFPVSVLPENGVIIIIPLQNLTIGQLLKSTARRFAQRPAMEYNGLTWSYMEMDQFSDSLAAGLLAMDVKKGDHVGIWAECEPNTILLYYALQKIGAVAVMICTATQEESLLDILRLSDVKHLAVGESYKEIDFSGICKRLSAIETLHNVFHVSEVSETEFSEYPTLRQIMQAGAKFISILTQAQEAVSPQDTSTILFTSGTTSKPKAVMSSHYSRVNGGIQQAGDLGANEKDRFCAAIPIFHCFSISTNVLAALAVGACLYLPKNRRTINILNAFDKHKCTILNTVPTMISALISRPDFNQYDLTSLRIGIVGGAPYSPETFVQFSDALGCCLLSSLGLTEGTAGITVTIPSDNLKVRSTTVGRFMNHVEGKIIDISSGEILPALKCGEICVRGYVVMQGFYKQPELTAEVIDKDGWLHTGDMGYLDENGNLNLTGRIKELIIRGGENISPSEIEVVLMSDSRISECKVIGIPDKHYGEEICVCIIPCTGEIIDPAELRKLVGEKLAYFKIPKYIHFFKVFPRTETGKIKVAELRQCLELMVRKSS